MLILKPFVWHFKVQNSYMFAWTVFDTVSTFSCIFTAQQKATALENRLSFINEGEKIRVERLCVQLTLNYKLVSSEVEQFLSWISRGDPIN